MSGQELAVCEPSARYVVQGETPLIHGFELLATAPGGVVRLRALIVSLALSGELTSQHARSSSEIAGAWPLVSLSDLNPRFQNGASSRGDVGGVPTTVIRLADITTGEISSSNPRVLSIRASDSAKYMLKQGDILVIRVNGSADLVGRFIVCRSDMAAIHCDHFIRMRFDAAVVVPEYMRLVGDSASVRTSVASLFISTAGQKTVNQGHVGSIRIALPPLAEQHRIVARVEELMKLCDALEQSGRLADEQHARLTSTLFDALAASESAHALGENWQRVAEHFDLLLDRPEAIDALEQTVLQLAVRGMLVPQVSGEGAASESVRAVAKEKERLIGLGAIKRLKAAVVVGNAEQLFVAPASWTWVRVADLCALVTDGEHATPQRCDDSTAVPLVTAKNVRSEVMDYAITDFVPRDVAAKCWLRCKPEVGDILMVSVGATLGRLCVLREAHDMVIVRSVTLLRPVHKGVYADYLALHLMSYESQREIWSEVKQSAQPGLYLAKSAGLKIALPPLAEQHRIVARVEQLRRLCAQLRERLTEARRTQSQLAEALVQQVTSAPNPSAA